ncbi:hypothetical protein EDD21DRAFT_388985 [Dissophora ornata]|nr:hypothetical protein BGZ58_009729 [Dissophora ornata]KAI8596205.1 hypothetical protein EDD21DRAFT_388985 [Dissophora ornata]
MAIDLSIHFNSNGTVSVGLTLVNIILDIFQYAIVSIFTVLIFKYYHVRSRWGEAMWLQDSAGRFSSLFASGQRVNGLPNFSGWHLTAVGFSATLFILGFSGTLLTSLFSTEPLNIDVFSSNVLITAPVWNASYNATALLSIQDAQNSASEFVHLLSNTQKLNLTVMSTEWDPEPTKVTPLKIYSSVTTNNGTTNLISDNLGEIFAYSTCSGLVVEYQNASSGAFRGDSMACTSNPYGFHIEVRPSCGANSEIWLTADSWGQLQWKGSMVPTAKIQQRELLTQFNGSTLRVSETYSTFDSLATTTNDASGIQGLCVSLMGVHRDVFDAGLCSNMTEMDRLSFQAMDLQYDAQDNALMVRYCNVNYVQSAAPGALIDYMVGCVDYTLQYFSIQSTGIQDGSGDNNAFYPTAAGSDMLSIRDIGMHYGLNFTNAQNTVLQVNIASSVSIQKFVPHQAMGELSSKATDFSSIHTDTRGIPGAQTLYTALLSKTLSDWQKPQLRAPVGQYRTTDNRPWIHTITLCVAIAVSLSFNIVAIGIARWWVSPYYANSFLNNVRATASNAKGIQKDIFANIRESETEGEPASVTLNSRRLTLEDSKDDLEKDYLLRSV